MTAPAVAIVRYTLRATVPMRRRAVLLVLCVVALLFGLLARSIDGTDDTAFAQVAGGGLFTLVLPLASLVVGDAVLGAEVRKGTFHFTWLSPVPRWQIALGRWLGGWALVALTVGPAFALAAVIAGSPDNAWPAAFAAVVGSAAYVAVFEAVGAWVKRAPLVSLGLVFLGEDLLGRTLTGIAQWSPRWESRAVFTGLGKGTFIIERAGIPDGTGAIVRLVIITIVGLAVATWRLRQLRLAGGAE